MKTRSTFFASSVMSVAIGGSAVLAIGCGGGSQPADAGTDAPLGCVPFETPELSDAGPLPSSPMCRNADGGMSGTGPCCFQDSQSDTLAAPELRLRYMRIEAPVGSPLMTPAVSSILNGALYNQTFNWLFRIEGADGDGPVTITTGFGVARGDGTYAFAEGLGTGLDDPRYLPIEIPATITGDTVTSERFGGLLTVPVLDPTGTTVQLELGLRNMRVIGTQFNTERSCVGHEIGPLLYATAGILESYLEVEIARAGTIEAPGVSTTVCAAIAGGLATDDYCDTVPQASWPVQPDTLCDATGCTTNAECEEDVCDRGGDGGSGLPTCNAWRMVARFAAHGVEISN
jgi:hypothetical protein